MRPHQRFDIIEKLLDVDTVVKNPFVQEIAHSEFSDDWMPACAIQLIGP